MDQFPDERFKSCPCNQIKALGKPGAFFMRLTLGIPTPGNCLIRVVQLCLHWLGAGTRSTGQAHNLKGEEESGNDPVDQFPTNGSPAPATK